MTERFNAIVGANIKNFLAKMREVHSVLQKTATGANADIGANVKAFNAKMTLVRQSLRNVEYAKSEATVSADISRFNRTMAVLKAKMLALSSSSVVVRVKADWNNFRAGWQAGQQMMSKIATSMRNFGEIVSTSLQGAFISVVPAISPIIANIGALIGSLGPVIGTVAGSTFALVGAFAAAGSAAVAFGAVAIPTIKNLFAENAKLNTEQQKAKSAFDNMKATYNELVKATEQPVLSAFTKAMDITKSLLNQLKPLFVQSAQAVDYLMSSLKKSIGTPPVQKFLEYLNSSGAPLLVTFGKAFGNVFKGIASMLTAFAPLSASTASGFYDMTKSFADWAAGLDKSKKFQAFISYVQTNMPKIKSIVGDAIVGIVNTFSAFAPMASDMLTNLQSMISKFREWSSSLSENQGFQKFCDYVVQTAPSVMSLIGNLTTFLVNLGVGMAPLGQKILEVANSFLSWVNNMMAGNPVIGQVIAVVTSLTGVIMAVLPWILSVGTGFAKVVPSIVSFASSILGLIPKIVSFGATVLNLASKALPWLIRGFSLLTGPVGIAIAIITALISVGVLLYKNWATIKASLTSIWNSIKASAVSIFTAIGNFLKNTWNNIKNVTSTVWNGIKSVLSSLWIGLKSLANSAFNGIKSTISKVWSTIKSISSSVWNGIKSVISSVWKGIKSVVSSALNTVKSVISNGWNSAKSVTSTVVNAIKTVVSNVFNRFKDVVSNAMSKVKSAIEAGWNRAKSFLDGIDLVSVGSNIIQGLINGIKSKVSAVVSTVSDIANKVTSTIKKAMDIHSPSRVTKKLGEHTGQGYVNGIKSKVKATAAAAKKVASAAKKAFNESMRGLDLKLQAGQISTSTYVKQAKALGNKYKSVTNAQNTVAAKIRKATTSQALKEQRERQAKQTKLQKEFNAKLTNLNNRYASNDLTSKQYISKLSGLKKTYKTVTNATSKINAKIAATKKKMLSDDLSKLSMKYSNGDLTTKQYLQKLETLKKTYKNVKGAVNKINKEYNVVRFEDDKKTSDKILANDKLTATQQVQQIINLSKKYKKGTEERVYFEQQAAEKKKAIYDGLIALNDEYTAKIQEANQKLIDGEKALNDEYDNALAERANSIKNSVGIFDEVPEAAETSGQQLKANLQAQVDMIRTWSENMASLASRGIDKGLLAELQALGPGAASQIAALNTLSDTELQGYVGIWQEKSTLATDIAKNQLTDLRTDTDAQIAQLRKDTQVQLQQYNTEWQNAIKDLTGKTKSKFNALTASMPAIGKNVIKGMQQGLSDMTPSLLAQADSISKSVQATIQKAFEIHSPSRWGKNFIGKNLVLGIIQGISNMQSKAVSTALELANEVKAGLTDGLVQSDLLGYTASSTSAINKELTVKVKVDVPEDGHNNGKGVGVVNQEVHLHSPRELSPSENARQMKKQAQKLALEWG